MKQKYIVLSALMAAFASAGSAHADSCTDKTDVLGTSRTLVLDTSRGLEVGQQYRHALPLKEKEIVLTFDDGPLPAISEKVRQTLKGQCVHATFFLVGRNAETYPDFVRKLAADGHTIASHTWSHDMYMPKKPYEVGLEQIDRGISAVNAALKTSPEQPEIASFFRFPGLNSDLALRKMLKERGIGIFDIDIEGGDWVKNRSPQEVLNRVMRQLDEKKRGIILLHDIQPRTAAMLPELLRRLKKEDYKVVHIIPGSATGEPAIAMLPAKEQKVAAAHTEQNGPEPIELVPNKEAQPDQAQNDVTPETPVIRKLARKKPILPRPDSDRSEIARDDNLHDEKLRRMAAMAPKQVEPEPQGYVSRRARQMEEQARQMANAAKPQPMPARYAEAHQLRPSQSAMPTRREKPKYLLNALFGIETN